MQNNDAVSFLKKRGADDKKGGRGEGTEEDTIREPMVGDLHSSEGGKEEKIREEKKGRGGERWLRRGAPKGFHERRKEKGRGKGGSFGSLRGHWLLWTSILTVTLERGGKCGFAGARSWAWERKERREGRKLLVERKGEREGEGTSVTGRLVFI